jgi:hypothetical protein
MREPIRGRVPTGEFLPEVLSRLRELEQKQNRLVTRLDSLEVVADGVAAGLREVVMTLETEGELESTVQIPVLSKELRKPKQNAQRVRESLCKALLVAVDSLEIVRHFDGSSTVNINKLKTLRLTPALTDLMVVLSADRGESEDGLVAWKTVPDICQELKKKPHAVVQLVFRFRKELVERAGVSGYLIQHSPDRGYRFALRRHLVLV